MKCKALFFILPIVLTSTAFADMAPPESFAGTPFTLEISPNFLIALIITLGLELLTAFIFLIVKKISKKVLISVLLVNMISLPILWSSLNLFHISNLVPLIIGEILVVLFEAFLIQRLNKKVISFYQTTILSLTMNILSFTGGIILWFP